ncbi:nonribosomal peptide synthase, putative [Aspergillus fumigatus A1163]|uniref:Nonribosomal peptide synthetase-like enzyme fsqF n=2 Tax=Aspergillus fumigatus TaxID=746128 RepID=FSQF_ASPFU|nr:nonribosomal peptide synthase, putative [Aspergillus fumigatus Af293]Q4WD47.1 RecName: Full=Nonribosomal peptide synthetase-like enzyme fsqF; AltName: Full=Fumipyrrole biosynthesis protein E; AltName: Full=Fumisoquins biosynthesis protein F [Aspergillus fumigatus Af293]EAL85691.1 nonribosomal peptide synthase, putative [Aspergillus fumigatus Af293]EDP47634.1 nonribosomal peptide synthase, putative [Aspergillus fumigatus A1163]
MLLQDVHHREQLDDDVENAFSKINGTARQASPFADEPSIDVPSTHLPVVTPRSKTANDRTGLAKSLPYASLGASRSTIDEQDVLIQTWAILLHQYAVSDTVAFAIIGKSDPSGYSGRRASTQVVCLPHLFLDSARATPHAPAVHGWDGRLTYAELDQLSNSVARQLLRRGVRKGQFVPFSFEKSIWMVVAIIGILRAGGVVASIDPSQPQSRAREIIQETGATVIVASTAQASVFAGLVDTVVPIADDTVHPAANDTGLHPSLPPVHPEDPAVVIFTSGSTGKPKGIVIQHGAVTTRMVAEGRAFQYHGARTLQFAASTWDIFMTDIFTTLAFNGCVCIPSEEDRRFNLARFCAEYDVSLALITPSLANLLEPTGFPTLKTLIFGGEALKEEVTRKWEAVDGISLHQGYGPAETGPCVAGRLAERPEILGYALDNSVCVLVDPSNPNRLVPLGAVGELVVGGPSLLREYINDPRKTEAAVIENPPWALDLMTPVRRFYRTGDLLRYSVDTLDGRLEFVGRTDDQVKYHGQRIELGEIEHHLSRLPGVEACVVVLAKAGFFKDRLVAVVQAGKSSGGSSYGTQLSLRSDPNITITHMRRFLSSRLPEFMIPNELLVVQELPHNNSMKLDRGRVAKWVADMQSQPSEAVPKPHTRGNELLAHESTARTIAREYARIVAGDSVARRREYEDRDFNLQEGGIDSIQIMSLSMFLTEHFGFQVPMADILSSRATVRSIASLIDANSSPGRGQPLNTQETARLPLRSNGPAPSQQALERNGSRVFLTGASGFLGIEILRQLLARPKTHVYALVRGSSESQARERLVQKAISAGWWQDAYRTRLHVWHGDLTQPQLGLSQLQWQMLQGKASPSIDAIIHNGAKVHYSQDYETLKKTNVSPTVELLKAVHDREEPLHSFVFVSGGQQLSFDDREDEKNAAKSLKGSGYARSKAVSEQIVRRFANQKGSKARHVRIVKPGFIIGDAERGLANQSDFIWRLIAACVELGFYNGDEADSWLFISDITRVAQVILHSVFEDDSQPVTKVLDGLRFKTLWALLQDKFGFELQPLSRREWLARLKHSVATKKEKHVLLREQFPALHHGVVPFNNAAGTVVHREAAESTHRYMTSFPYELGRDDPASAAKTQRLQDRFAELAAFMNADPDEIAFGQSTTFLLRSLGQALKPLLNSDCEIIVSILCHEGSAAAWVALAKDLGIAIKWWAPPPGDDPVLSLDTLRPLLTPKTRLVACNHVSNVVGTIHPIRQVADLVHRIPGAVLVVDGVAWAPHRPIDVKALDVDFYCFSWYKVFGPHVAQLYGRRSAQKRALAGISHFFLSEMPGLDWRLRLGANSFELEEALVPITRYLKRVGWDNIIAQETVLQDVFLAYLRRRPRVFRIFGEQSSDPAKRVPVITFEVIGHSSTVVANKVNQRGRFRVVSGNCWAPRPTHDVLGLGADGLIRVSFVHYNTVAEVQEFCTELDSVLETLNAGI